MSHLAPEGGVYQAGTLSGNPVAMAAGLATLTALEENGFYERLAQSTQHLVSGILAAARDNGIGLVANRVGGMFGLFFSEEENISNYEQVTACNVDLFKKFFHGMLQEGVYLAPSAFEAGFISSMHSDDDIEQTVAAAGRVFGQL